MSGRREAVACALLAAMVAGACHGGRSGNANADANADADADADGGVAADARAGGDAGDDEAAYFWGVPTSARAIGHTSLVFKIELTSGKKAVFKPGSRRGPIRYKGEIAARRLGVLLGIADHVPLAFARTLEAKYFAAAAGADEMIATGGAVKGALIPWIDHLDFLALEAPPLSTQWKQWLRRGETIPEEQRGLARQVSMLVAFDFVSGNWDRWSGGNVGLDKASGRLLFIDNDGAFFEVPPQDGLLRNRRLLDGVDRFSRAFIEKLRAADDAAIARAMGEDSDGTPLLSGKALAGVSRRRRTLLEVVDAKIADGGDETFAFP